MKTGIYIVRACVLEKVAPKVGLPTEAHSQQWTVARFEPHGVHVVAHENFEAARIAALAEGKRSKLQVTHLRATRLR